MKSHIALHMFHCCSYSSEEVQCFLSVSTFVDPRFKQHVENDEEVCHMVKEAATKVYYSQKSPDQEEKRSTALPDSNSQSPGATNMDECEPSTNIIDEFFGQVSTASEDSSSTEPNADMEVSQFKREKQIPASANPLQWWKDSGYKYPMLSALAKTYLGVQATSVASERVFSNAGDLISAKRSLLAAESVDRLIFLKKNYTT